MNCRHGLLLSNPPETGVPESKGVPPLCLH